LIIAAYAFLSVYNFEAFKPRMARVVRDATGRELRIDGDINLRVGLTLGVSVEDVGFENASWGTRPEMATVKRFEVQFALWPLIRRDIELKRLTLIEPDILLETDDSERSNLEFEKKGEDKPSDKTGAARERGLGRLLTEIFRELQIESGLVTYRNGQSGKTQTVKLDRLKVSPPTHESPVELQAVGDFNGLRFEMDGNLGSLFALFDPEEIWPVKFRAKTRLARITVAGTIRDVMDVSGLTLNIAAEGRSIPEIVGLEWLRPISELGPFRLNTRMTGSAETLSIVSINFQGGTEETTEVSVTGAIQDVLAFKGFDLGFTVRGRDLAALERFTQKRLPLRGPFDISGKMVDPQARIYQLTDLGGVVGDNDFRGSVELNFTDQRPRVTADLSSARFDLRPLMVKNDKNTPTSSGKKKAKVFPDAPLSLDKLRAVDVRVHMKSGQILFPNLALDDLTADFVLEKGHLTVDPFRCLIGGGSAEGRLDFHSQDDGGANWAFRLKISRLDLGLMLEELGRTPFIDGTLNADMEAGGRGSSVAQLMAGLDGRISVVVGEGRLDNKYVDRVGGGLTRQFIELIHPFKKTQPSSKLNCLLSQFDIEDGLAKSKALVVDTTETTLLGKGQINLKTEKLNLAFGFSPKKGVGIKGVGKVTISLGKLANTVKLGGTLANPSLAANPKGTSVTIGKVIGGMALLGPLGAAAALLDVKTGDQNPCSTAIEAARMNLEISELEEMD
jgi:uncharacterized protein involved in outer membrane biogenesis